MSFIQCTHLITSAPVCNFLFINMCMLMSLKVQNLSNTTTQHPCNLTHKRPSLRVWYPTQVKLVSNKTKDPHVLQYRTPVDM